MRQPLVLGTALLLAACRYQLFPVPVSGERAAIASLAGEWVGDYRGRETARTGSIMFNIRAAGDSAFGDVLMATPGGGMYATVDSPAQHARHTREPELLAVSFVSVVGNEVSGAIEPYVAPDCECVVQTTFTGRITGDTIAGEFRTRGPSIPTQSGWWRVLRHSR
jgi:hypothetical protein